MRTARPFSDEDVEFIRAHLDLTASEIAKALDRTCTTIWRWLERHSLRCKGMYARQGHGKGKKKKAPPRIYNQVMPRVKSLPPLPDLHPGDVVPIPRVWAFGESKKTPMVFTGISGGKYMFRHPVGDYPTALTEWDVRKWCRHNREAR
jgi:hypothetical protein